MQASMDRSAIELLRKEVETLTDVLERDILELQARLDQLRLEHEAVRRTLGEIIPEFESRYREVYNDLLQRFDPELEKEKEPDQPMAA